MDKKKILIIAGPGEVREGIKALLEAIPGIGPVDCSASLPLDRAKVNQPVADLVILDFSVMDENCQTLLSQLKQQLPCIKTLVLVDREEEELSCQAGGIDAVLIKGFRGGDLVDVVQDLLKTGNKRD